MTGGSFRHRGSLENGTFGILMSTNVAAHHFGKENGVFK